MLEEDFYILQKVDRWFDVLLHSGIKNNEDVDKPEKNFNKFRFYLYYTDLIHKNQLTVYFELFNESTQFGDIIKKNIPSKEIEKYPYLRESIAGSIKSSYFHIAVLNCKLDEITGNSLEEKLRKVIEKAFFKDTKPFVKRCADLIKK